MEICKHNNVFSMACPECKQEERNRSPVERLAMQSPHWVKYVTTDKDGQVWGFSQKPEIYRGEWIDNNEDTPFPLFMGQVVAPDNYENTLIKK